MPPEQANGRRIIERRTGPSTGSDGDMVRDETGQWWRVETIRRDYSGMTAPPRQVIIRNGMICDE